MMIGLLYLVSTPIGNMEDISLRTIKTIGSVDILLCEDTRHTGLLISWIISKLEIQNSKIASNLNFKFQKPKLLSYQEHNEFERIPEVISILKEGKNIALVSDAGTPTISDPGFKLVRECIKNNIQIITIPGSTALISALTLSGLPTDRFTFFGYFPEKKGKGENLLQSINSASGTIIFYESCYRIKKTLLFIKDKLGDIEIVVCSELTKIYEKTIRGKISNVLTFIGENNPKGEYVLLFNLNTQDLNFK